MGRIFPLTLPTLRVGSLPLPKERGFRTRPVAASPGGEEGTRASAWEGEGVEAQSEAERQRMGDAEKKILDRYVLFENSAYSTVTLFARLRGWSTSVPFSTAV